MPLSSHDVIPFALTFLLFGVVFVFSLLATAKYLVQLLHGEAFSRPAFDQFFHLVLAGLCVFMGFQLLYRSASKVPAEAFAFMAILPISVAWLVSRIHRSIRSANGASGGWWKRSLIASLFALSTIQTIWSGQVLRKSTLPREENVQGIIGTFPPGELQHADRFVGVTDAGRDIGFYRWSVDKDVFSNYLSESAEAHRQLAEGAIERTGPDVSSNCHGWVFTGGRFLLRGSDVETILVDNGYTATLEPKAGDLAIYRTENGRISHTGLVRGILSDGTVMVESKWGIESRFLHQVESQPYSRNFGYWTTKRPSHIIKIRRMPAVEDGD